ncbi:hypothetical protein CVU37_09980 [candidate division BRC1 bacterium HGW-BRC1-1]|nr:MAG: hypothetical protein CVU37_09980 [candidate division BRC1 bacterium HGW-BRC1-1]
MNVKAAWKWAVTMMAVMVVLAGRESAAQVRITSPVAEQCVPGPDVAVHFQLAGTTIAPVSCNIHWVLDDGPFQVQFDATHPHIFRNVAPGTHTIRVFVANRLHEAIPGYFDMVTFHVMHADDENRPTAGLPLLTYNLPQGEYRGIDAADVALNFIVTGGDLCPTGEFQVNAFVDGKRFILRDTNTFHLKGLLPGLHKVRLELVNRSGRLIGGPFNSAERTILLSPEKSLPRLPDGSQGPVQPVLPSIHGDMTQGLPWAATETDMNGELEGDSVSVDASTDDSEGFSVRPASRPQRVSEAVSAPTPTSASTSDADGTVTDQEKTQDEVEEEMNAMLAEQAQPVLPSIPTPTPVVATPVPTPQPTPTPAPTPAPAKQDNPSTAGAAAARAAAQDKPTTVTLKTQSVSTTQTVVKASTGKGEERTTTATASASTTTVTAKPAKLEAPTTVSAANFPRGERTGTADRGDQAERPNRAPGRPGGNDVPPIAGESRQRPDRPEGNNADGSRRGRTNRDRTKNSDGEAKPE